jgi:hypothetical protein
MLANIIVHELSKLDLSFPSLSTQQKKELEDSKKILSGEDESSGEKTDE